MANDIKHYFDYAAATPVSQSVIDVMMPYFSDRFYNPSAMYLASQSVKADITNARSTVANVLGCKASEIIFTAGGTESDNLAINGVMEEFPNSNCIVSAVEHYAVLKPAAKYPHKLLPVLPDGRVDISALTDLIDDTTVLVSIIYANNEIGTIQPLHKVAQIIKSIRDSRRQRGIKLPIYLHTDACQAANYLLLKTSTLGVDLMTVNGGKIYGPKQSGALFVKTGTRLSPQILGGGQERGYRSGTENPAAIIGFATALDEAQNMREAETSRLIKIQQQFIKQINNVLPQAEINGSLNYRLPNNVHITLAGQDNERLMMELDERGIMVATGSACSASKDEASHVLKALGNSDELAQSSIRISFGRQTTSESVEHLINNLSAIVA